MVTDEYLSLDGTLCPKRVGVAYHHYNKNKPPKYGLLFQSINSAEIPYTYTSILCCRKPPGEPTESYITTTDDLVKYLVTSLTNQVNMQGHYVLCDWFYTSIKLANWLLEERWQSLEPSRPIAKVLVTWSRWTIEKITVFWSIGSKAKAPQQ